MALKFEYDKENRVAKVCGVDNEACTEIVIPATVEYYKKEYKVTSIGQSAFWGCKSLTSVTIPNSVTAIGGGAFCNCVSLKEFKGKYAADGGRCLIKDSTFIAYAVASGTTYAIPDGVTEIGKSAFGDCKSLTRVTIPNSVTEIGESAFESCELLTSVTIPDSVTAIRFWAFRGCTSLTSVTIPDSVTSIERSVFNNCVRLKEFKGKYAADGGRCLIKDSTLIAYAVASGTIYAIPDGVTSIESSAFRGCKSLTRVTIPNSVTEIGNFAFLGCESLANVTIPSSVIKIGKVAFKDCKSLKEVRICNDEGCVEIDKAFSSTAVIHYVGKDWIDQAEKAKAAAEKARIEAEKVASEKAKAAAIACLIASVQAMNSARQFGNLATFTLQKSTTVGEFNSAFFGAFGANVRVYQGRSRVEDSVTLGECGLSAEGTFECRASLTVGSFIERMQSEHGLKVKVYTCDEWVAVLDGLTLESAGKVKKNAAKADMESMIL